MAGLYLLEIGVHCSLLSACLMFCGGLMVMYCYEVLGLKWACFECMIFWFMVRSYIRFGICFLYSMFRVIGFSSVL